MNNEIASTHQMAEDTGEDAPNVEDMTATVQPENAQMEFHIQMRSYTQHDFEGLVIEAAAQRLLGKHSDRELAKKIEARVIALLGEKITEGLSKVTDDIIDQPLTPSFGDKKPVTMREFIGLTGREYLSVKVDSRGRAKGEEGFDSYYNRECEPRIQHLVTRAMDRKFSEEISSVTTKAINEFRAELKKRHEAVLAAEMQKFRDALAKSAGTP